MRFILVLIIIASQSAAVFSQRCGGGVFSIHIYVPQSDCKKGKLNYDVLFCGDSLASLLHKKLSRYYGDEYYSRLYHGIQVHLHKDEIDMLISDIDDQRHLVSEAMRNRNQRNRVNCDSVSHGVISDGKLSFATIETGYKLCILRVSDGVDTIHVLANLFGGCSRQSYLHWNDDLHFLPGSNR